MLRYFETNGHRYVLYHAEDERDGKRFYVTYTYSDAEPDRGIHEPTLSFQTNFLTHVKPINKEDRDEHESLLCKIYNMCLMMMREELHGVPSDIRTKITDHFQAYDRYIHYWDYL